MGTTKSLNNSEIDRKWYIIDAEGQVLGRLASDVAHVLRGKHKPEFTPNADAGDFVVVINASKIKLTGNKLLDKKFYHHTTHPGGIKEEAYGDLLARKPEFVIEKAVKGMLPKNTLGRQTIKKLKVYADDVHPHAAQKPQPFAFKR